MKIILPLFFLALAGNTAALFSSSSDDCDPPECFSIDLPVTTTGPPWPPSEVVDETGDFIAIGPILEPLDPPSVCFGVPNSKACFGPPRSVIVSKDTIPPLDANGKENFVGDLFGAEHVVVRELDLSEGSDDLDIV